MGYSFLHVERPCQPCSSSFGPVRRLLETTKMVVSHLISRVCELLPTQKPASSPTSPKPASCPSSCLLVIVISQVFLGAETVAIVCEKGHKNEAKCATPPRQPGHSVIIGRDGIVSRSSLGLLSLLVNPSKPLDALF